MPYTSPLTCVPDQVLTSAPTVARQRSESIEVPLRTEVELGSPVMVQETVALSPSVVTEQYGAMLFAPATFATEIDPIAATASTTIGATNFQKPRPATTSPKPCVIRHAQITSLCEQEQSKNARGENADAVSHAG